MGKRIRANYQRALSTEEAENSVYFDFEGNKKAPPALLGWLHKSWLSQVAIGKFASVLAHFGSDFDGLGFFEFETSIRMMVKEAQENSSFLVSFSTYDYELIKYQLRESSDRDLFDEFQHLYVNGKYSIDKAFSERLPKTESGKKTKTLKSYAELIGYSHSDGDLEFAVGPALSIINRIVKNDSISEATLADVERNLSFILNHNSTDLILTKELTQLAAKVLYP